MRYAKQWVAGSIPARRVDPECIRRSPCVSRSETAGARRVDPIYHETRPTHRHHLAYCRRTRIRRRVDFLYPPGHKDRYRSAFPYPGPPRVRRERAHDRAVVDQDR